jgi:two-component system, LytTR family, response regulator
MFLTDKPKAKNTMHTAQLTVHVIEGVYHLPLQQIVRLKASSNYTEIYLSNKKKIVTAKVLKRFAAELAPLGFVRTHRTHLVNKMHIRCVQTNGVVRMNDDSCAGISRRMKTGVLKAIYA